LLPTESQAEKRFRTTDYTESFLVADIGLKGIIQEVCQKQWEKELLGKFLTRYTIKKIVTDQEQILVREPCF
jgi:hypothetical protein